MNNEQPTRPGQVVTDAEGRIGIITESARKSGGSKGKIGVMWAFSAYAVLEVPEDLTVVAADAVRSFAASAKSAERETHSLTRLEALEASHEGPIFQVRAGTRHIGFYADEEVAEQMAEFYDAEVFDYATGERI